MNRHDDLYRQLALRYTETVGSALRQEAGALGNAPTPELDRKVRAALARRRQARRRWTAVAALAACVALALYALPLWQPGGGVSEALTAERDVPTMAAPSEAGPPTLSVLPLSFDLPPQFSVDDVTLDRGQTVYTLADRLSDPVVLTLEQDAEPMDTSVLTALDLAGRTVYAKATADYSLITFDSAGIRYVMTCRYDVNTLLALSRAILL